MRFKKRFKLGNEWRTAKITEEVFEELQEKKMKEDMKLLDKCIKKADRRFEDKPVDRNMAVKLLFEMNCLKMYTYIQEKLGQEMDYIREKASAGD